MSNNINWTKCNDGSFCTEISEFRGERFITLPDDTKIAINWFTPHKDQENEVTHWDVTHRGIHYTLFND